MLRGLEVRKLGLARHKALVIPQASIIGLASKLTRFKFDEVKALMLLGGLCKTGVKV
jgi:hypothetical protein